MEEKKPRSYAKESTKTTPSGIRFDKEQLEFVQGREKKLTTKQKVVDFLLNKFWWENKVEVPSHKGLPPSSFKGESYESRVTPITDEPLSFESMEQEFEHGLPSYEQLEVRVSKAVFADDKQDLITEISRYTHLDKKEQQKLIDHLKNSR